MCARVPTCDMSVARPRTNAQRACAVATYDLVTYERSHRLTLGAWRWRVGDRRDCRPPRARDVPSDHQAVAT